MLRGSVPSLLALALCACGGSPAGPSAPAAPKQLLEGQTVNAIDGTPSPNLSLQIGTKRVTSDASGYFSAEVDATDTLPTVVRGASIVERETTLTGFSSQRVRLSLIPASFDLESFNEMFRTLNARLERWTSRPSLVVLASVMNFRNVSGGEYEASGGQLSAEEVEVMVAHLTEGLTLLTGGAFTSFASVSVERPASDQRVSVTRPAHIVVGRYTGLVTFRSTIGFGQWLEQPDGTINGGAIFLDEDFDRSEARRRLLRIHELGHALGYQHVRARTSIMNVAIGPEPTDFDRAGSLIAFQRPPGNRSPDVDPAATSRTFAVSAGGGKWSDPVFCY